MGLSGWFRTALQRFRRGQARRRSGWLDERSELRLYITQLEERRVLTASPVDQNVTDFAAGGAMSDSRFGSSSLTFEHTAVPAACPTPSAMDGELPTARDNGSEGNSSNADALASPAFTETRQGAQAFVSGGNLVFEHFATTTSSKVTLQLVHDDGIEYLQIDDPSHVLVAGTGTTRVDDNTLRVPTADLTGNITVTGSNGNDTLTIDLSHGNPIPEGGLVFQAGDGHDNLNVIANGQDVSFLMGRTAGEGTITVGGRTIRFTGVEPDTVTLTEAATVTLNLTDGDTVNFSRVSALRSRAEGTSNAVEFDNPTTQLVIDVLDSNDYALYFNSLAADFNPAQGIEINGSGGAETVTIRNLGDSFSAALAIDLGAGIDRATFDGSGANPHRYASLTVRSETIEQVNGASLTVTGSTVLDNQGAVSALMLDDPNNDFASIQVTAVHSPVMLRDKNLLEIAAATVGGRFETTSTGLLITGPVSAIGATFRAGTGTISGNLSAGDNTIHLLGGTFHLDGSDRIDNDSTLSVGWDAVFAIGGNNETVHTLIIDGGSIIGTTGVLTSIDAFDGRSGSIEAILAGSNGLSKSTGGTLILSGDNTYTGQTTVAGGVLLVDGATAAGSAVSVENGATLGGSGTIGGTVSVADGGLVAPGAGPGILQTGSVVFASGAVLDVEIHGTVAGTQYDRLDVTGTVSLGGAILNVSLGFTPAFGAAFTLVRNDLADAVVGTFADLPEGQVFTVTTGAHTATFQITYQGGDGNDVVLKTIDPFAPVLYGTPGNDRFLVMRHGTDVAVYLGDNLVFSRDIASITGGLTLHGGDGHDTLLIDYQGGDPVPGGGLFFNGGPGNDSMAIRGTGLESGIYHPGNAAGTDGKKGTVQVGASSIHFDGLEPLDVTGFASFTIDPAGAVDDLTIADGFNLTTAIASSIDTQPALLVSGASGGVAIETIALWNVGTVTVNTAQTDDGDDTITIASGSGTHGITDLIINTGVGNDLVKVIGALAVAGNIQVSSQNIQFADDGTLTAGAPNSVTLDAGAGAISRDGGKNLVHITAQSLNLSATTGIGGPGLPIHTQVQSLQADVSGAGSIYLNDQSGGVTLTGVSAHHGSIEVLAENGTLTVGGAVTATGGDLLLSALGGDLTINAAATSVNGPIRLDATRDIVVQALVHAGGDILLLADSDNDGQGGLWVQASGKVAAGGDIVGRGSDIFRTIDSEADRTEAVQVAVGSEGVGDGIRVDADNHHADADQMVADGSITLSTIVDTDLVLRGVIRTTGTGFIGLHPSGNILLGSTLATAGGRIRVPRPTLLIGDTVLTTNVTTELTDNHGTQDPSLGGDISWVAGATIDSQAGQSHRLTLRSGIGATTFNANVGGTTALASLVVANTTGRVTFGGADLASGDLAPVFLVRTYGDIDVGLGTLDTDEVSGGIVLNGGSQPDATLTFRTLNGGNVRFNGPVTLSSDVVITTNGDGDTGTGRAQAGDITFTDAAAVASQAGEHNNLVLRAGTGTIRFGANVGQTVSLQSLTVEDTTGGVIFGTADAVAVDSETGPVTLVRTEGDLVLGAGPLDPGVTGQIVFNGGAPPDELLVHTLHGAIRIRGNVMLGSTTTFRHTGEASLSISGGTLNILDPNSQLVIDALSDAQADAPTDANPTGIIDSRITGAGRLVKTGDGWLKLTYQGDNTYGGGTTIAGGTLSISKDGHLGSAPDTPVPDSILIDGATLYVRRDVPMDQLPYTFWLDGHRGITLGPASGAGYGEIFVQRDVMVMYSGVVADHDAGTGSLHKTGPGILMLNGLNTYTGPTYIMAGRLLINGSTSPASTVYVGGQRADDGVWIGGEPIRVTDQYAMLGGVGVVPGNVYVLGVPEIGADWVPEPPGGHVNPGSILDQAEWFRTTKPDGTVVETWGLPTVPGILTVGPIEFLPNSYLNIDFGNGGEVDPVTGWRKAPGFPYPGGSAVWEQAFADWQSQPGPERGLPPVDRTGYDQLRVTGDLTINAAILNPNLQYIPLAWEAQFLIADFDGQGQVIGSLFQDRTYTIDGEDYVLRYDRGPNNRSIAFESAGFTPVFRALPTPTAPVLVVARGFEPGPPAALRPHQEPPTPPVASLAAGSEVVTGSERFVEVRVVTPIDDAGNVDETTVLKLPVSVLRDLRRLVEALPDDRYRVYLVVEHGQGRTSEEFLVRELYVREGRPVDRDERLPSTTQPADEDDANDKLQTPPDDGQAQGAAKDTGPAAVGPAGAIAGGAALWQARVDQAIAKHAKRLPGKAVRLCRGKRIAAQTSSHGERVEFQWEKGPSE